MKTKLSIMEHVDKPLVNRVAASGLITLKLEDFFPEGEIVVFDLKPYLFRELILKEKDFRQALKIHDWQQYAGKNVAIHCSADAIIPMWAYMLITSYLAPHASFIAQGDEKAFLDLTFQQALAKFDPSTYEGKRIVIKGCGDKPVPASAYVELTRLLRPYARSIMYGEPCSTVPVYKQRAATQSNH